MLDSPAGILMVVIGLAIVIMKLKSRNQTPASNSVRPILSNSSRVNSITPAVLVATTPTISGYVITKTYGNVVGIGTVMMRATSNKLTRDALNKAEGELKGHAAELGANAVLGTQTNVNHNTNGSYTVTMSGTAVLIQANEAEMSDQK